MSLCTARLCLRSVESKDIPALVAMLNDWEVAQWLSLPPYPYTVRDGQEFCALCERNRGTLFGIATLEGNALVGSVEIFPREESMWGVGYWLGRDHWGQGYARESLIAVIEYARSVLGLTDSIAIVDPDNAPSCKLLMGLGFALTDKITLATPTRRGCREVHVFSLPG